MVQVVRRQAPIFVIRAKPPVEERKACRVVDQVASFAMVQLVRVVVHKDIAEPANVERDVRMIRRLKQQNETVRHQGRGQIHAEEIRNDDQGWLELTQ